MKKFYWSLLLVPALLVMLSDSFAQPGGGHLGRRSGGRESHSFAFWRVENVVEEISLTPTQIQQLNDVEYNFRMGSIAADARLEQARLELDHILSKDTYSEQKTTELINEITAAGTEKIKLDLTKYLAIRGILTQDQWSQLDQMKDNRLRKMRKARKQRCRDNMDMKKGGHGQRMRGMDFPEPDTQMDDQELE